MRAARSWSLVALLVIVLWPGPPATASPSGRPAAERPAAVAPAFASARALVPAGRTAAAVSALALAPGGWAQDGYDATGDGFNPAESRLTPARVPDLRRQWTINAKGTQVCAAQAAPVTAGGRLFLTGRESIGAYDAATGKPLWTHAYADPMDMHTPQLAVAGETVLAASWGCQSQSDPDGYLVALDAATGAVRWDAITEAPDETLTVDRGVVVVGGADSGYNGTTAFALATGKKLWEQGQATPSAAISAGGTLLLTHTDDYYRPQATTAVDLTTGKLRWRTPQTWSAVAADPSGTSVLAEDGTGTLLKVDAGTGKTAWTHPGLAGPLAVDTERAYVATTTTVQAIDLSTGKTVWQRTGYTQPMRPILAGGVLYVVTPKQRVDALTAATGTPLKLPVTVKPVDHAVVADGWLYLTDGSQLSAYTIAKPH